MIRPKRKIRAQIYNSSEHSKTFFGLLKEQKDAIHTELGYELDWENEADRRECRASVYLEGVDPENKLDWQRQHEWLAARLNELHRVFFERVRILKPERLPGEGSATKPA